MLMVPMIAMIAMAVVPMTVIRFTVRWKLADRIVHKSCFRITSEESAMRNNG